MSFFRNVLNRRRQVPWAALRNRLALAALAVAFVALFPGSTPAANRLEDRVIGQARDALFNYVEWNVGALVAKIRQVHASPSPYLDEPARSAYVVDYLRRVAELQRVEAEIARAYSNPATADLDAATADQRARRDVLRGEVAERQPLAEAIAETQVASVLRDEGFAVLGAVLPPVSAKITDLPMALVISPREVIRRDLVVTVAHLTADEAAALESRLDRGLDVSSLAVPLGGLALYPSMIYETGSAPALFELIAHEWVHNYLLFFPLGWELVDFRGDAWTINETTASLFGDEVARKVGLRFYAGYPDVLAALPPELPPEPPSEPVATPTPQTAPPAFDLNAALGETRRTADALLAEGKIEEAEAYMEAQRAYIAENGYVYRKINQAFFAFYGAYQSAGGGGAAGADPVGPAIAAIRRNSRSLHAWIVQMRTLTTRDALLAARDALPND
ncbi:MAG: hypothetical protein IT323_15325 [Anaerolineae bacterium]|nr:hypothetical protein [Anaerolineae bacterium]